MKTTIYAGTATSLSLEHSTFMAEKLATDGQKNASIGIVNFSIQPGSAFGVYPSFLGFYVKFTWTINNSVWGWYAEPYLARPNTNPTELMAIGELLSASPLEDPPTGFVPEINEYYPLNGFVTEAVAYSAFQVLEQHWIDNGISNNPYVYMGYILRVPTGYYFDFPSWAPAPDWYHFATLIKAGGETYGKEIAVTREAPGLPFNMEVWRKDPDPSEIYQYFPKQFLMDSNLLEELEDFPDISPSAELAEIGGGEVTPVIFYPWLTEPPTDQQFTPAQLTAATTDPETGELIFDPDPDGGDIMPDSLLMKKVAAAVEADRYGVHPTNPDAPNLNNLGRLIEAIGYLLGINLDPDGINIPYPDPEYLTPEQVKEISHLKTSQFAAFDGAKGMQTATLYDIRANVPVKDKFGKTVIQPGGAIKTWNLAQFLDQMSDDTEAQLGGAALASLQVPAGDGKSYIQYEGLGHAIQDALFMLSVESKRVDELVIQSARTIHLLQQVLMGLGLPMRPDTIDFLVGAETATAEDPPKIGVAPVASLDPSGPTITSLFGITLANLSRLVAGTIGYQVTGVSAAADSGNDEIPDPFDFEEDLPGINL